MNYSHTQAPNLYITLKSESINKAKQSPDSKLIDLTKIKTNKSQIKLRYQNSTPQKRNQKSDSEVK